MDIITQIWLISIISILMTVFVAWQAYRLGTIMNASFGKWEAVAWVIVIIYRSYGLTSLTEDAVKLRDAGYIVDSLTFRQWVQVLGFMLFLSIIMYSKHLKRKKIRETLGV